MASPLLLMSTTSSSNNNHQEMPMNPPPLAVLPPHPTTARHHHDGRRSAGRPGKKASSKAAAPKKPAQRGPGVAQLEFLRYQEQLKKMAERAPQHLRGDWSYSSPRADVLGVVPPLPLGGTPVPQYCLAPPTPVVFPGQMVGVGRAVDVQRSCGLPYGSDRVVGGFYSMPGVGGSAGVAALEPPSELSSIPNLRCIPEHCDICLKKNELANARNIVVFDHGAADRATNSVRQRQAGNGVPDFLELNLGNRFSHGGKFGAISEGSYGLQGSRQLTYQDVQQAMNNSSVGGEESRRLMEYEFFPGKSSSGSSTFPKTLPFPSSEHRAAAMVKTLKSSRSSSVGGAGAAEASCSNPNPIDLSLRLSY